MVDFLCRIMKQAVNGCSVDDIATVYPVEVLTGVIENKVAYFAIIRNAPYDTLELVREALTYPIVDVTNDPENPVASIRKYRFSVDFTVIPAIKITLDSNGWVDVQWADIELSLIDYVVN